MNPRIASRAAPAATGALLLLFGTAAADPISAAENWVLGQIRVLYLIFTSAAALFFLFRHEHTRLLSFLLVAGIVGMVIYVPGALEALARFFGALLGGGS